MEYNFRGIEAKWSKYWNDKDVYRVTEDPSRPKYYVLDMFPYPSGTGLHVGHPLGYVASDIMARYKRLKGFNVLHPMGYDAFGLPAEQYALERGIHPAVSTETNTANFRKQLDKIGFCFDWSREFKTSEPSYYKWTQWIFLQLFNSFYNRQAARTQPVSVLVESFEKEGSSVHPIPGGQYKDIRTFTAAEWKAFDEYTQQQILMEYRVAFCGYGEVNWCEGLGTVLANDEVINGVSERGGFPVVKKTLRQWYLRITEYADRLLDGLQTVDFSDAMKEMQTNWIGKSTGAEIDFAFAHDPELALKVFTTRPDTIFGVDFMVIAPEHELIHQITSQDQLQSVEDYISYVKSRSERERMAEKKISGVFTGAFVRNPFNGREIPVWASEYVLAGYGTGAIMGVPSGDERDHKFAKHFNLNITNIIGSAYNGQDANPTKDARLENSDFLNGMVMRNAIKIVVDELEKRGIGKRKINYKMRDAAFSRQRYWGEPFPIKWIDGIAIPLSESELPLELPHVESYKPGPEGEGPLANIPQWTSRDLETNTMPGYAGSSWYFLRYMDPHNDSTFCDRSKSDYWQQVDLYVGGTEHAVGHLLYSRMWTKALFDLGHISFDEPFKKLLNQGMIQGSSRFAYRIKGTNQYVSAGLKDQYDTDPIRVDVTMVDGLELDTEAFRNYKADYADAEFILENDKYICGSEVEKMSKTKLNAVNPDDIIDKYGADTFRMYEMFLGPVEMSKPWDTKGIEGVFRFLRKFWRLFYDDKGWVVTDTPSKPDAMKVLHKTIKKISEDTERYSFNTSVSAFMVAVNELTDLKTHDREVLEPLVILIAPYAPHIAEQLWHDLGHETPVLDAQFPAFDASHLVESTKEYPVSINGKLRTQLVLPADAQAADAQQAALSNEIVQKWMEGRPLKKFIFVQGKMINVVA